MCLHCTSIVRIRIMHTNPIYKVYVLWDCFHIIKNHFKAHKLMRVLYTVVMHTTQGVYTYVRTASLMCILQHKQQCTFPYMVEVILQNTHNIHESKVWYSTFYSTLIRSCVIVSATNTNYTKYYRKDSHREIHTMHVIC